MNVFFTLASFSPFSQFNVQYKMMWQKPIWKRTLNPKWCVAEPEVWVVFLSSNYLWPRTKNEKTFLCHLKLGVSQVRHTITFYTIQILATHVQIYFYGFLILRVFVLIPMRKGEGKDWELYGWCVIIISTLSTHLVFVYILHKSFVKIFTRKGHYYFLKFKVFLS